MPCAGSIDSQSTKIASRLACPEEVGTDGNKFVNGRKRHLLEDTLGLIRFCCPKEALGRRLSSKMCKV